MPHSLGLIWAQSTEGVIGAAGTIPWLVPGEQRRFRELTDGGTVIMGRATWDSLPEKVRPLPGRENVVVTRQPSFAAPGAIVVDSPAAALAASAPDRAVWCIGGAQLYAELIGAADRLEVTEVDVAVAGDAFAPSIGADWLLAAEGAWLEAPNGVRHRFLSYRRRTP